MGQLIYLDDRRKEPSGSGAGPGAMFFFDVADPLSYLAAERVERLFGQLHWVPVDSSLLERGDAGGSDASGCADTEPADVAERVRSRADACARALRLPLVWPDRFPASAPCALRATAFACELGAGTAFALAASRLAFCGGFDLEDPETLAEAAAAAGVPLEETLTAAGETWRDEELREAASLLRANGITEVPAVLLGRRWFQGEAGLRAAAAAAGTDLAPLRRRPMAPIP